MTTPERIWARAHEGVRDSGFWIGYDGHHLPTLEYIRADLVEALVADAVAKERERCAHVAEREGVYPELNIYAGGPEWYRHGKRIAAAIRAGKGE